jgi:hypothetical protein
MKQEKEFRWVNKEDFQKANPLSGKIREIQQGDKDLLLIVNFDAVGLRKISLWGDNKNNLIEKLGDDDTLWIGKNISFAKTINPEGKVRNILTAF